MKTSRRTTHAVHFVGIGGIGMSALARYFLALGKKSKQDPKWLISGSDAVQSSITKELTKEGVEVKIGHKKAYVSPETGLVIYNRAIPRDNPELLEAKRLKIPIVPYARVLGEITKGHMSIAITGSHGKTTTTGLTSSLLIKNDFDPTVFVGSKLKDLHGRNFRIGKSRYLVLEADDFGAAFLEYSPKIAIVTNIDHEHLDFYKTFSNLKHAFLNFLMNLQGGGFMILNRDDKNLFSLQKKIAAVAKKKHAKVVWYSLRDPKRADAVRDIKKVLKIVGSHNMSNALAVYELGVLLKIPKQNILRGLASYHGAWRRMEYRGMVMPKGRDESKGALIFDDYAHHPTEIRATLQAFRERFPRSLLVCVFQPHQAKRLQALFREFQDAFTQADKLVLLPIYKVAGRDETSRFDAKRLAHAIKQRYKKQDVRYIPNPRNLMSIVKNVAAYRSPARPVIVMMGAGDVVAMTDKIVTSK